MDVLTRLVDREEVDIAIVRFNFIKYVKKYIPSNEWS